MNTHIPRSNIFLIFWLSCLVILPMFATDIYTSSLPLIQKSMIIATDQDMKLTLNMYLVGFAISNLIAGFLSNYLRKVQILFYGLLLFSLSSLAITCTDTVNYLIIFRFIEGLGGGTGTVLARLILQEEFDHSGTFSELQALSVIASSISLSPLIGPVLGAFLSSTLGWKSIFYFLGIMSASMLLFTVRARQQPLDRLNNKKSIFTSMQCLVNQEFLLPTVAIGLSCATEFIFISESSFIFQKQFNRSPFEYGIIASCVLLSFLIGSWLLNRLVHTCNRNSIIKITSYICCATTTFLLFVAIFIPNIQEIIVIITSIITMIGVGIMVPLTQSMALNFAREIGNTLVGFFFFIELFIVSTVGYIVSCFIDGVLPLEFGISGCWFTLSIIYLFKKTTARVENIHAN